MNNQKIDVYEKVTNIIIEKLEQGVPAWKCGYTRYGMPKNYETGKEYRGINSMLLSMTGKTPFYLTYLQAKDLGGHVKKNAKGFPVVFWKMLENKTGNTVQKENGQTDEIEKRPFLRYYTVFSIDDVEGIKFNELPEKHFENTGMEDCENIIKGMPNPPAITLEVGKACYYPAQDVVNVPPIWEFESTERYYNTFFHELVHSTGHTKRLNRPLAQSGELYSKEELIAEMGASFLCAKVGINDNVEMSASYLASWLSVLKNDKKFIVEAASKAQKAVDYILNVTFED